MTFERLFFGIAAALTTICMGLLVYVGNQTTDEIVTIRQTIDSLENTVATLNVELVKLQSTMQRLPPETLLYRVSALEAEITRLEKELKILECMDHGNSRRDCAR